MKNVKIATLNSGVKYQNRDDFLLVSFEKEVNIAGVFTTSSTAAAPVLWCQKNIKNGKAKALIVNAGNANAFTGIDGEKTVLATAKEAAKALNCLKEEIFISSTGVIGEVLSADLMTNAVKKAAQNLEFNSNSFTKAAKAIMTTDLSEKLTSKTCQINGQEIELTGFAKGSGMIQPNMATMLGYIFTNANISAACLSEILKEVVQDSFNAITVDSDTSTNDTVLLFADKSANNDLITSPFDENLADFKKALFELCLDLAKKIVIDGEGATKLIEVEVNGAENKEMAKICALAVANSPLVKTAIAGNDPNWGRIVMAVGKSCPSLNQNDLIIKMGDFLMTKDGKVHPEYDEEKIHQYLLKNKEVKITINLGIKNASFTAYTCDLTEGYIKINKDYRS